MRIYVKFEKENYNSKQELNLKIGRKDKGKCYAVHIKSLYLFDSHHT